MTIKEQERDAIQRFQGGEEAALAELARLHRGMMYRLAWWWYQDFDRDVVEHAKRLACWKAARDFDLSVATRFMSYYEWKFKAETAGLTRERAKAWMTQAQEPGRRIADTRRAEKDAARVRVGELLEGLTPRERVVMGLHLAGYDQKEIGRRLGYTHQWVSLTMIAAKNKMQVYAAEPPAHHDTGVTQGAHQCHRMKYQPTPNHSRPLPPRIRPCETPSPTRSGRRARGHSQSSRPRSRS